jgi:hypothetical protein
MVHHRLGGRDKAYTRPLRHAQAADPNVTAFLKQLPPEVPPSAEKNPHAVALAPCSGVSLTPNFSRGEL